MANAKNTAGKRIFDDVYSFPQDSQDLADDVFAAWNVRVGTSAERGSFPSGYLREGLVWVETDTRLTYQYFSATGWRLFQTSRLITQWHKNIPTGSAGGQPLGPSGNSYVVTAVPYARAIRVSAMGGVLPAANGNGGVSVAPSTGTWAGGANEHRVNATTGGFNDLAYVWFMTNLPANTALTLTMISVSSVAAGYDLHFTVEEF